MPKLLGKEKLLEARQYLRSGACPADYRKDQKQRPRETCERFRMVNNNFWKRERTVAINEERRKERLRGAHDSLTENIEATAPTSRHGRDKTLAALQGKYWRPKLWLDVDDYVRCQKNASRLEKSSAQLLAFYTN